jgi:probable rRNA maturation factor
LGVEFRCASARGRRYARALRRDAIAVMEAAGLTDCELSLTLTSDASIRKLNREYRKKDRATDVLSFSQLEERGRARIDPRHTRSELRKIRNIADMSLGDVVISIDTALAQAREDGIAPADRLRALLIHGFLHLLGYDHERSAAEARRMFAMEGEIADHLRMREAKKSRKRPVVLR